MEHPHHHDNQQTVIIYSCPMHPQIKQDKPGNYPKCRMNLVPIKAEADKSTSHPQKGYSN